MGAGNQQMLDEVFVFDARGSPAAAAATPQDGTTPTRRAAPVDAPAPDTPGTAPDGVTVRVVDDGVGMVLDKLDELKLTENTLVFFLSDNGGPETKNASDNGPLRGAKGDAWEGGFRVPYAVRRAP